MIDSPVKHDNDTLIATLHSFASTTLTILKAVGSLRWWYISLESLRHVCLRQPGNTCVRYSDSGTSGKKTMHWTRGEQHERERLHSTS